MYNSMVKVKVVPVYAKEAYRKSRGVAALILNLDESGQLHTPAALPPRKKTLIPIV